MTELNIDVPKDYPYFNAHELQCKCQYPICKRHGMNDDFMDAIINLRTQLNFPFVISSAYRCPNHNNDVSSTGFTGPHTTGKALDIRIDGTGARVLLNAAIAHGFEGIGINQSGPRGRRFIHLDMFERPAGQVVWSY